MIATLFYAAVIVGSALAAATALWGWRAVHGWLMSKRAVVEKRSGLLWQTAESEIDDWVGEANRTWPALKVLPLFYVACLFTLGMIVLDVMFGWSRGGNSINATSLVYILLFVGADLALPIIALQSDKGTAAWHSFEKQDRSWNAWALISLFTFMSMIVVIGSTSEVSTVTSARNTAEVSSIGELRKKIELATQERDQLQTKRINNGGLSREALEARATETAAAAEREGNRKKCASKCETLKAEALEWESQAADARREQDLNEELAVLHAKLRGRDLRDDADPLARFGEEVVGIPGETTQAWGLTFLGVLFAIGTTILWLIVADKAGEHRAQELARRGGIGDERRRSMDLPPKYTAPLTTTPLLEHKPESTGDTIIVNMAAQDMRARFKNDTDLLEVDGLFGTLMAADEAGAVTVVDLYRAYKIDVLRANHNARYMTQSTMVQKLSIIAQHRDDVQLTADGRIVGWLLAAATTNAEAAE